MLFLFKMFLLCTVMIYVSLVYANMIKFYIKSKDEE